MPQAATGKAMSVSSVRSTVVWLLTVSGLSAIHDTGRNAYLIILARTCRMFAFGGTALILAIFFAELKFSDHQIGLFMTLTLLGDVFLGTSVTLVADRLGRRKVLFAGSLLMIFSGVIFRFFESFWILLFAAVIGVISVTSGDFGPFRSIEESVLSELTTLSTRPQVIGWYVATSLLGSSAGSEVCGRLLEYLQEREGWTSLDAYHSLFWVYVVMGLINMLTCIALTKDCELPEQNETYTQVAQDETGDDQHTASSLTITAIKDVAPPQHWIAKAWTWLSSRLSQISAPTRAVMYKLWFLLAIDSLADGMVPYSLTNYYLDIKFHPNKSVLGDVTSVNYFLGAFFAAFAGPLAHRIGLINTMVFTHIPSSAAVLVFPFAPYFWAAAVLLCVRGGLNNMDQAPRAAFIAAVVKPEERTAAMGITAMLRTSASIAGPTVTSIFAESKKFWIAFVLAGIFRLAYDLGLYAMFVNMDLNRNEKGTVVSHQRIRPYDEEEEMDELDSMADSESTDRTVE